MLAAVKTSFFCPKNVGFLKSKLAWAADANPTMECRLYLTKSVPCDISYLSLVPYFPITFNTSS